MPNMVIHVGLVFIGCITTQLVITEILYSLIVTGYPPEDRVSELWTGSIQSKYLIGEIKS